MVPSEAMLGFQMERPGRLTVSGRRLGSLHVLFDASLDDLLDDEPMRSTRQRLETRPGTGWPGLGVLAEVRGAMGRVDWKMR
jgi:hypothetical protein